MFGTHRTEDQFLSPQVLSRKENATRQELPFCVEYNISDAFEKEVDTEVREW